LDLGLGLGFFALIGFGGVGSALWGGGGLGLGLSHNDPEISAAHNSGELRF